MLPPHSHAILPMEPCHLVRGSALGTTVLAEEQVVPAMTPGVVAIKVVAVKFLVLADSLHAT